MFPPDGSKDNVSASLSTDMATDLSSRVFDDVTALLSPAASDKLLVLKVRFEILEKYRVS